MSTKFSIIMPAFNVAAFIEFSIQSVLAQSIDQFELIIIDDGSSDTTFEIADSFKDHRIRIIRQKNRGLGNARNAGINIAIGEYIAFLDSDDIWGINKLKNVLDNLEGSEIGVYYTDVMEFTNDITKAIPSRYTEPIPPMATKDLILIYDFIVVSSAVVNANVIREFDGFSEDLFGTEDWDLWIRIGQKYQFKKISAFDCYYRMNNNGLSKNRTEFLRKELKVITRHLTQNKLGSAKVERLAFWVWYKKNFYYYVSTLQVLQSIRFFVKMFVANPLHPANFDFIIRGIKKISSQIFRRSKIH